MPALSQTLPSNDIGFLRIVASLWGLELASSDPAGAAAELAESLCDIELLEEVVSTLPGEGRPALEALAAAENSRMPWVAFTRRFGELREMGAAKRDREQPHLHPGSAAEILFYRALLARAFFATDKGPQEFAFIPDDLLEGLRIAGLVAEEEEAQPQLPKTEPARAVKLDPRPEPPKNRGGEPTQLPKAEPVRTVKLDPRPEPPKNRGGEPSKAPNAGPRLEPELDGEIEPELDGEIEPELEPEMDIEQDPGDEEPGPPRPIKVVDMNAGPVVLQKKADEPLGRPASPAEKAFNLPADDRILDDACTYLAALRMGIEPPALRFPAATMREFLQAANIFDPVELRPEAVKNFLEAPRDRALEILQTGWQSSRLFNELRQLPGLLFDGSFDNQPHITREFLLDLLEPLPDGQWWSLASFVRDVKTRYPDFQRPAGDYDSWFIKRQSDGAYLRGFGSWDEVDGALVRYLICGPLHWLGLLDLAGPAEGAPPSAFRSRLEPFPSAQSGKLTIGSQGKITVPRLASLAVRYQIARFCEWDTPRGEDYTYRVTAASLKKAAGQGLKPEHLLALLRKQAPGALPPVFVKAMQRWEQNGTEARVESLVVLKVSRPEVLKELQASRAARFLGVSLGATTVVIQPGAQGKVMEALAELGILAEGRVEEE